MYTLNYITENYFNRPIVKKIKLKFKKKEEILKKK